MNITVSAVHFKDVDKIIPGSELVCIVKRIINDELDMDVVLTYKVHGVIFKFHLIEKGIGTIIYEGTKDECIAFLNKFDRRNLKWKYI